MALSRAGQRLRALMNAADDADFCRITLQTAFASRLGLRLRRGEAKGLALRTLGVDVSAWSQSDASIRVENSLDLDGRLDVLAEGLAKIAERPLTGRLVVETLGITNQERLRWTKDGRLRQSGSASIRRAHALAIQTYDPDRLAEISLEDVRAWRARDAVDRLQKVTAKNI